MKRASAPTYDRFKLIVTIVLLIILLLMLLRGCATNAVPVSPTQPAALSGITEEATSLPTSIASEPPLESTETFTPSPAPAIAATATPTVVEPTATSDSTSATPTTASTVSADAATAEATATITAAEPPASREDSACNTISPSRLAVGQQARVLQRLNLRNDASIAAPILQVNPTGTQVEVIGGPVCTPVGERAYLWWQIRLADGTEGWSAETPLNQSGYFLQPAS